MKQSLRTPSEAPAYLAGEGNNQGWADVLALGFGTALAMWAIGFFCRLPDLPLGPDLEAAPPAVALSASGVVPGEVLFSLLLACMLGGGFLAGKLSPRGWRAGLYAGAVAAALNLFIVLGIAGELQGESGGLLLAVIPAFLGVGALLGAVGGAIGSWSGSAGFQPANRCGQEALAPREINWLGLFALLAAAATLLMLAVGGLVTSFKAGLAVPDWPNTFGCLLFFYPLSKMSGGIYFEHSHRLLGALVGVTVIVLVLQIFIGDERKWLRRPALAALVLVAAQGVLGGLRVTGRLTLSSARADMEPSTVLAVLHGVTAQVFFGLLVALCVFLSRAWRRGALRAVHPGVRADRRLHVILAALLALQVVLGVIVRQQRMLLHLHLTIGALALALAFICGARAWGLYGHVVLFARLGKTLLALAALQGALGVVALFALGFMLERKSSELTQVAAATGHQTISALLLGCALCLLLCGRRFLEE